MEMKQSFSTSEVAKYCHVTADTIRKWAEAGRISVFKTPGGHRRIRREDLVQFLRENSIPVHGDLNAAGVRILLIDPERSVAQVVRRLLDRARTSFHIESAFDAFDAGRLVAAFHPDVIFLDLRLPGMDALEVLRRLKEVPELSGCRIIGVATADDRDLANRAVDHGAISILTKPFTPDDLRRALAKVGVEVS
ncbi:MAG: response regulator [Candidatus Hydrogenedentes bacterium]|nr:response regulator [Candidatus Hydrogenedentota bacterium]